MSGVIIYGSSLAYWQPLKDACREERPDAVMLLGDWRTDSLLRQQVAMLFEFGPPVRWVPDDQDVEEIDEDPCIWLEQVGKNLHRTLIDVGGLRIAGLGGVFREVVWYPRYGRTGWVHRSRFDRLGLLPFEDRWEGSLPPGVRDAIFPEDIEFLKTVKADVLVTRVGPSCHVDGFVGIDMAAACDARLIVHGHHDESCDDFLMDGNCVTGLVEGELLRLRQEDLR